MILRFLVRYSIFAVYLGLTLTVTVRIVEIFRSLQGESTRAGQPCLFVRLAGCDLLCRYCDTPQAHDPRAGRDLTIDQVVAEVEKLFPDPAPLVEITGGEPLLQRPGVEQLAARFLALGSTVMLETNGAQPIRGLDPRLEIIMDVKTPGSGAADRLCLENLPLLDSNDELKFVLTGRDDYDWACRFLAAHDVSSLRAVHFSPAWSTLAPATLAGWMLTDRSPARLAVQLHKLLGLP
jgi:7-carboxy-7-deazaguanine synthase